MRDLMTMLRELKRPGLLVRAARFGLDDYRRDSALRRVLKCEELPRSGEALMLLMELEDMLNTQRKDDAANYSPGRHISVLTALMGETRILRDTTRQIAVMK